MESVHSKLVRLFQAGELTEIWEPGDTHEAMRDLARPHDAPVIDRSISRDAALMSVFLMACRFPYDSATQWNTPFTHVYANLVSNVSAPPSSSPSFLLRSIERHRNAHTVP